MAKNVRVFCFSLECILYTKWIQLFCWVLSVLDI